MTRDVCIPLCLAGLLTEWASTVAATDYAEPSTTPAALPGPTVEGRSWTPQVSIAVRYFDPETVVVSPDGSKFLYLTFHGDLQDDSNISELTVFPSEDVRRALAHAGKVEEPAPLRVLTTRSASPLGLAIRNARWESDGDALSFEGIDERDFRQLYQVNVRSGVVSALTNWPYGIGVSQRIGDTMIGKVSVSAEMPKPVYPAHVTTRAEVMARVTESTPMPEVMFVSYRGGAPRQVQNATFGKLQPWLSEDGRRAVALLDPKHVPAGWAAYDHLAVSPDSGRVENSNRYVPTGQFYLVDAEHGLDRPVFDAPSGLATDIGKDLATDGKHLITDEQVGH